jgi:hypothetical protein
MRMDRVDTRQYSTQPTYWYDVVSGALDGVDGKVVKFQYGLESIVREHFDVG